MKKSIYVNYREAREHLSNGTFNLLNDSFGQYETGKYSTDLTVRDYDGTICIDFDVYDISNGKDSARHCDGGLICKVNKLPLTEHGFWKLVQKKVGKFIEELG